MVAAIDLASKVALITGSSRGIGKAIARRLAEHGAKVILNGRAAGDALTAAAAEISHHAGIACGAIPADISVARQVSDMMQRVFREYGRLDVLVNNAGVLREGVIGMIREPDIAETLGINVAGLIHCTQGAARLIQRSGGGAIINMASIIGIRGNKGQFVYGTSKGAVVAATLSAAKELAGRNIRVNAIAPGFIETDMIKETSDEIRQTTLAGVGLGRFGTPEDVADVALFLASDLARYVTGQIIGVDGGMTI